MSIGQVAFSREVSEEMLRLREEWRRDHLAEMYGMYCPSLDDLGRWILGAEPLLKAGLVWYLPSYVCPVLRIELPFVEGMHLQDFCKITIGEFASYSAFRDFLRKSFLDMDTALNAVQSDRELLKLGLDIKDHVRSVRSESTPQQRTAHALFVRTSGSTSGR